MARFVGLGIMLWGGWYAVDGGEMGRGCRLPFLSSIVTVSLAHFMRNLGNIYISYSSFKILRVTRYKARCGTYLTSFMTAPCL